MITKDDRLTLEERRRINIQGVVQGVGFRPFVYGLASEFGLSGFVLNDECGVTIEVEGSSLILDLFVGALAQRVPPLARVDSLTSEALPLQGDQQFTIIASQTGQARNTLVSPDTALCEDCLAELLDPSNRRFHYPFINCTNCGPRFTIIQDVPYDRDKTTMRVFRLCDACQAEYDDPLNRRFHAQPNACPDCGPYVSLLLRNSVNPKVVSTRTEAIEETSDLLWAGKIIAIKGLGGYHLACDALDAQAVGRLRFLKHREAKPFALMVANLTVARQLCVLSSAEAEMLSSRRRPIVLLQKHPRCPVANEVAPGSGTLGLMLPYTPLQVLLLEAFATRKPNGQPAALVMTSGNLSEEPIAFRDEDALERLAPIVDGWLVHNREIYIRSDDSVIRDLAGGEQFFRRSRGYAPEPIRLKQRFPMPILACGGQLKNTFCLGKEDKAFISHHIGELENLATFNSLKEGITHYQELFGIEPKAIAYDLHPEYLATKYALESDIHPKIGVQHHHAHIASVLAEHGLAGPIIGVAADGTGYGTDGAIWGGELLLADLVSFERLFHLAYVPLPGGEQAIRQPWRMAAVFLHHAYGSDFVKLDLPFVQQLDKQKWNAIDQMIQHGLNCPATSSLGRLFDAIASLVGLRSEVQYEGQAAMELEAQGEPSEIGYHFDIHNDTFDVRSTIRAIVSDLLDGMPIAKISGHFHRTIAEMLLSACQIARQRTHVNDVALSGGVFQNKLLMEQLLFMLERDGFRTYINRLVPPNDGGLSLGQAAIAAARLAQPEWQSANYLVQGSGLLTAKRS